ncbi:MAG: hypothetical protein KKC77_16275, partial [Proteobacteria bacterium]|nr:hypothetical protein [Pseudomonadota bacterium]
MKNDIPAFAGTFFKVGRFIPLYWLGLFYLLVSFLLRLVLFVAFGPPATVPLWHLPPVLGLGLINDMIQLLYLL